MAETTGREIRTQTQALLDDGNALIDFPGDSYLHRLSGRVDYNRVEALLLTHWHSDHFYERRFSLSNVRLCQWDHDSIGCLGNAYVKGFL